MLYLVYLFVTFSLVAIDQYSKSLIVTYLELNKPIEIIPNFFKLNYVQNFGAGFSIMQNSRTIFLIITPVCLICFAILLLKVKKGDILSKVALLLIMGGTIGNFIDRIATTYVVDFLDFYIFGYDFPVFNFADICLTIGVFLYIIVIFKESKNAKD